MTLELDPSNPSAFKYDTLGKHVHHECVTTNPLGVRDSEGSLSSPGVAQYSTKAGVPLPQMPIVVNILTITSEEIPAPAQATEEIPIDKAQYTINM